MQDRLGTSPAYRLLRSFWTAVDWLYPPRCGGCQQAGIRWCADCEARAIKINSGMICPVCGTPQTGLTNCTQCLTNPPPFREVRSWAIYQGPVREAIHRLKYRSDLGLSDTFAQKLAGLLVSTDWTIDIVTVVPLGRDRLKERGFNQADLLARSLALAVNLPYRPSAVTRVRDTQSQVGLTAVERRQNVMDAFTADPQIVAGKNLLIVDDVITTGATLSECSRAVIEKNAYNVYGVTIARALADQPGSNGVVQSG